MMSFAVSLCCLFFCELMGFVQGMDLVLWTECFLEGDLEGDLVMGNLLK